MDQLREKAVKKLEESVDIEELFCQIDGIRVKKEERDKLLQQLKENKIYLKVPIALYIGSQFWRTLKNESQKEIQEATR